MNKHQLVQNVAVLTGKNLKTVNEILNGIIKTIGETVADGESVILIGFGTFQPRFRKSRRCRNPRTGEVIQTEDSTVATFKAGKKLKERVKNSS